MVEGRQFLGACFFGPDWRPRSHGQQDFPQRGGGLARGLRIAAPPGGSELSEESRGAAPPDLVAGAARDRGPRRRGHSLLGLAPLHRMLCLAGLTACLSNSSVALFDLSSALLVLPLVPPGRKFQEDGSPYAGQDANCGNTLLISLEELVKDGLLLKNELPEPIYMEKVQFATVAGSVIELHYYLELKYSLEYLSDQTASLGWLYDAALFAAIDRSTSFFSWDEWPEHLKNRHLGALEQIHDSHKDFINVFLAQQFLFQKQWKKIRSHANKLGVSIMGDMPIYVGHHSADVWANKKSFLLDRKGFPVLVSGVPPDAFSQTGQLWGSPLYDWCAMEENGYAWWIRRIKRALDLYDEFRIDHFRGFAGFWSIPSGESLYKAGPSKAFFDAIFGAVGKINIIAEDLGVITEDVIQLRKAIGAPGMAVLQFVPNGQTNPGCDALQVQKYLTVTRETSISWMLINAAVCSVARTAIIPMQDILSLGSSARMNIPATQLGNWSWRIPNEISFDTLELEARRMRDMLSLYNRL
ncbi:4-alpha-glucanotransferase DPE1, chloroplastic/amyloplastic [Apostasia shenzhenica]|uniref:4-alpha-glucanotransferase n=1 Tax=Apostasia shenzhenica TaxID=1088818 RepID=A0A2I0AMK7_9ASPA|nr:4-alpha-glucanotransferase DPE1, chloroplastic/amyloplastic [Apostasia shenzhenica]